MSEKGMFQRGNEWAADKLGMEGYSYPRNLKEVVTKLPQNAGAALRSVDSGLGKARGMLGQAVEDVVYPERKQQQIENGKKWDEAIFQSGPWYVNMDDPEEEQIGMYNNGTPSAKVPSASDLEFKRQEPIDLPTQYELYRVREERNKGLWRSAMKIPEIRDKLKGKQQGWLFMEDEVKDNPEFQGLEGKFRLSEWRHDQLHYMLQYYYEHEQEKPENEFAKFRR